MSEGKRERGKEKLTHNLSGNERQGEKKSVIEREQDRVSDREKNGRKEYQNEKKVGTVRERLYGKKMKYIYIYI